MLQQSYLYELFTIIILCLGLHKLAMLAHNSCCVFVLNLCLHFIFADVAKITSDVYKFAKNLLKLLGHDFVKDRMNIQLSIICAVMVQTGSSINNNVSRHKGIYCFHTACYNTAMIYRDACT